jgi:hypothetical protein
MVCEGMMAAWKCVFKKITPSVILVSTRNTSACASGPYGDSSTHLSGVSISQL